MGQSQKEKQKALMFEGISESDFSDLPYLLRGPFLCLGHSCLGFSFSRGTEVLKLPLISRLVVKT